MLTSLFAAAAVGSATLAIAADWNERRRHDSFYLLKPLTTLMIIGLAVSAPASTMRSLMLLALALSLLGDICLMFDGERWFVGGLSSFLLAHLAFIPALLVGVTAPTLPLWSGGIVVAGLLFFAWLLPKAGRLKPAVLVYGLVLMGMALAAAARWTALPSQASMLLLAGALLFMLSDSSLAVRQFVSRYRMAQPLILSTYWGAIGLMAYALVLL